MEGGSSRGTDGAATAEPLGKTQPVRKRHRLYGEKLCQVCGDKALAHHFGALACETCKAFFRRNALKQEDSRKCMFEGKCSVDKRTRRFCPPCRLQKCFSVGMRADLILDDNERRERMQKVIEKRIKQQKIETCSSSMVTTTGHDSSCSTENLAAFNMETAPMVTESSVPDGSTRSGEMLVSNPVFSLSQVVTESVYGSHHLDPSSTAMPSMPNPTDFTNVPSLMHSTESQDKVEGKTNQGILYSLSAEKALIPFEHVPREQLPSDPFMYWRLSEEERCLLTKLSAAYQDTLLSVLQTNPPKVFLKAEDITNEFYFEESDVEVRSAINFAKRMEDFQTLRTDEQVALLKASTCQVLGLRSSALFIAEKEAWLCQKGYFTPEHASILCPQHPHLDICTNFCKAMKAIIKNDFTLYALLHCVILFDPCDERIIDRQLINSIRDKYIILLRHYLESLYSYSYSEKYLLALQEKIVFFRDLCADGKSLIKKFFPIIPNQLVAEAMGLD